MMLKRDGFKEADTEPEIYHLRTLTDADLRRVLYGNKKPMAIPKATAGRLHTYLRPAGYLLGIVLIFLTIAWSVWLR
jgi:hypothetical protein